MHQRLMDAGITNEAVLTVEVEETPVARANDDDSAAGTRKVTEQEKEVRIHMQSLCVVWSPKICPKCDLACDM